MRNIEESVITVHKIFVKFEGYQLRQIHNMKKKKTISNQHYWLTNSGFSFIARIRVEVD